MAANQLTTPNQRRRSVSSFIEARPDRTPRSVRGPQFGRFQTPSPCEYAKLWARFAAMDVQSHSNGLAMEPARVKWEMSVERFRRTTEGKRLTSRHRSDVSCFMSYSAKDAPFAERLHCDLTKRGVRCWFAPEHLRIGDRIMSTIERVIGNCDRILVILSESSIDSDWVEREVNEALRLEEERRGSSLLFPIRLDSSVKASDREWVKRIREADTRSGRHIGDFSDWERPDAYSSALTGLLAALRVEYNERA